MRGKVREAASGSASGVIRGDDARLYHYTPADLRGAAPQAGQEVMFDISGSEARNLLVVVAPGNAAATLRRNWLRFYLSPRGRISRKEYWLYGVLVLFVAGLLLDPIVDRIAVADQVALLAAIPVTVLSSAMSWSWVAITVKRFHDRGHSGWWTLAPCGFLVFGVAFFLVTAWFPGTSLGFVTVRVAKLCLFGAFAALVYGLAGVLIRRGEPRYNRFGPDPLAMAG